MNARRRDALTSFTPRYDGVRSSPADLVEVRRDRRAAAAFAHLFRDDELPTIPDFPDPPAPRGPYRPPFARRVTMPCRICGRALVRTPRRDRQVAVCATPCRGIWASQHSHARARDRVARGDPPARVRHMETRACAMCGAAVVKYPSQFVAPTVTCSRACAMAQRRARAIVTHPCVTCGQPITRRKSGFLFAAATCSRRCWSAYANARQRAQRAGSPA
jgi:endogenous inhibitor of DNA gyrase (YacG/DUF329 family)